MSLALGAAVWGRALRSRWGLLLLPAWGAFLHPGADTLALPEEDNSALQNLSRFWNLVWFFFFGLPWSGISIFLKKYPTHMWSIIVSEHLFSALCLYSDVCSSLVWSDQQVSEFRNLAKEKTCLKSLCPPPSKMPQALREWYFSAKVNLVEMLWPPLDYSQWHQALQAKQRHLGKITPLKLPAEELNLTPTNYCTIVTGINGIC